MSKGNGDIVQKTPTLGPGRPTPPLQHWCDTRSRALFTPNHKVGLFSETAAALDGRQCRFYRSLQTTRLFPDPTTPPHCNPTWRQTSRTPRKWIDSCQWTPGTPETHGRPTCDMWYGPVREYCILCLYDQVIPISVRAPETHGGPTCDCERPSGCFDCQCGDACGVHCSCQLVTELKARHSEVGNQVQSVGRRKT